MHTTVTVTQFKSASKHTSGSHAMICQQTRIRGEYLKTPDVMFWWKESSCTHAARGNSTVRAGGHTPALRECVSNEFSSLILRSVSGVQRRHEKARKKLEGNILQGLSRNALVSGCTAQRFMEAKKCPSATALGGGRGAGKPSRRDPEQACSAEDVYFVLAFCSSVLEIRGTSFEEPRGGFPLSAAREPRRADAPEASGSARRGDMSELMKAHRKGFVLPHCLQTSDPAAFPPPPDSYPAHWYAVEPLGRADPTASSSTSPVSRLDGL